MTKQLFIFALALTAVFVLIAGICNTASDKQAQYVPSQDGDALIHGGVIHDDPLIFPSSAGDTDMTRPSVIITPYN